jgi:hypothetical protein
MKRSNDSPSLISQFNRLLRDWRCSQIAALYVALVNTIQRYVPDPGKRLDSSAVHSPGIELMVTEIFIDIVRMSSGGHLSRITRQADFPFLRMRGHQGSEYVF